MPETPFIYTSVKTVIFDFMDNWGYEGIAIRSIEFKLNGVLIDVNNTIKATAYSSSQYNTQYVAMNAFNVSLSKIGSAVSTSWKTNTNKEQRLIIQFSTPQNFDEIIINNYHDNGQNINSGVKNTKIYINSNKYVITYYGITDLNMKLIFNDIINTHINSNTINDQKLLLKLTLSEAQEILQCKELAESNTKNIIDVQNTITTYVNKIACILKASIISHIYTNLKLDITMSEYSKVPFPTKNDCDFLQTLESTYNLITKKFVKEIVGDICIFDNSPIIENPTDDTVDEPEEDNDVPIPVPIPYTGTIEWDGRTPTIIPFDKYWDGRNHGTPDNEIPITGTGGTGTGDFNDIKAVIIDCANNYGNTELMGLRSIEFHDSNGLIPITLNNIVCYGPIQRKNLTKVEFVFLTNLLKTGYSLPNSWITIGTSNIRIIVNFNTAIKFNKIFVNNFHLYGTMTNCGVKQMKIYTSKNSYTDTVYANNLTSLTKIFDGTLLEHVSSNIKDDKELTLR